MHENAGETLATIYSPIYSSRTIQKRSFRLSLIGIAFGAISNFIRLITLISILFQKQRIIFVPWYTSRTIYVILIDLINL